MSASPRVRLDIQGAVATLTLDKEPVNALDAQLVGDLEAAFETVEAEQAVGVLVVRSARKVFCAGADLAALGAFLRSADPGSELRAYASTIQALVRRFESLPAVTVCHIEGPAMGGGLELALAADFRLASEYAKLGLPEVALGLIPAAGGTQRLARLCGLQTARRLILRGRVLDSGGALQLGLVDEVFPVTEFEQRCAEFTHQLSRLPVGALRSAKSCLNHFEASDVAGFEAEVHEIGGLIGTADAQARIRTFLEKS